MPCKYMYSPYFLPLMLRFFIFYLFFFFYPPCTLSFVASCHPLSSPPVSVALKKKVKRKLELYRHIKNKYNKTIALSCQHKFVEFSQWQAIFLNKGEKTKNIYISSPSHHRQWGETRPLWVWVCLACSCHPISPSSGSGNQEHAHITTQSYMYMYVLLFLGTLTTSYLQLYRGKKTHKERKKKYW